MMLKSALLIQLFFYFLFSVCQHITHKSLTLLLSGIFMSKIEIIYYLCCFGNYYYIFNIIQSLVYLCCLKLLMVGVGFETMITQKVMDFILQYERVPIPNSFYLQLLIFSVSDVVLFNPIIKYFLAGYEFYAKKVQPFF